jgi:hypothetical protein
MGAFYGLNPNSVYIVEFMLKRPLKTGTLRGAANEHIL